MKLDSHKLPTAVIGSWPKPDWLAESNHEVHRWDVYLTWKFQGEELRRKQDEATEWAIREQEATGVDIVSDGEERRENYIYYHLRHMDGFDFERRVVKTIRGGIYDLAVPTITGPIAARQVFLPSDYRFLRERTDRMVVVTIPGPMTIIDSTKDEYYGDEAALAMDLAAAIHGEVEALAAAGCRIIQFDEPGFMRYPEKVYEYGIRALEACFDGIPNITTLAHLCCGYPTDLEHQTKASTDNYLRIAPALAASKIDRITIEDAHDPLDLAVLRQFGEKGILLGLVDIGYPRIETVEEIEARIREALDYISPWQLSPAPDCGMLLLTPEIAKAKLTNLVEAARRVRESLNGS